MDARKDLYAFAIQGKENSPAISERASRRIEAFRAAVIDEVMEALQERAGEFSELAEEEMRPSLEERAQEWSSASEVAGKARKSVVWGKSVSVRVAPGGRSIIKKKKTEK